MEPDKAEMRDAEGCMRPGVLIDIKTLPPAVGIDGRDNESDTVVSNNGASPAGMRTSATSGAKAPGMHRRYERICAYGYLGFWICAVCIKFSKDFRRDFCPFTVRA